MANIPTAACTNCGKSFTTDDLRGVLCRHCGALIAPHLRVQQQQQQQQQQPQLQVAAVYQNQMAGNPYAAAAPTADRAEPRKRPCKSCGASVPDHMMFCLGCGAEMMTGQGMNAHPHPHPVLSNNNMNMVNMQMANMQAKAVGNTVMIIVIVSVVFLLLSIGLGAAFMLR